MRRMTIDDICTQYHLTRLAVMTRLATAKLYAIGGKYERNAVAAAFAPPEPPPMSDAEAKEELYDWIQNTIRF